MFSSWNDVLYDTTCYDLVICGNSRAWKPIDPHVIDSALNVNCYNLGIDGHGVSTQVMRYNVYCSIHGKPKYIIQNIDHFSLICSQYQHEQYLPYLDNDILWNSIQRYDTFSIFDRYVPMYRYIRHKNLLWNGLGLRDDLETHQLYKGFASIDAPWDGSKFDLLDSVEFSYNPIADHV